MTERAHRQAHRAGEVVAADPAWYRRAFGEEYLRAYASALSPGRTARDVEGIVRLLALPAGSAVLDLCCGHGRHAVALAAQGYRVTGLDLSEPLLRRARTQAQTRRVPVHWVRADMREIPFEREFDAVINVFTSFGYLETEDEDRKVLDQVRNALKPGGLFLLETADPADLNRRYVPALAEIDRPGGGVEVRWTSRLDRATGRFEAHGTLRYPDGRTSETCLSMRPYTPVELGRMLERAGLRVRAVYGGLDGRPCTAESRRLVVLGRRAAGAGGTAAGSP